MSYWHSDIHFPVSTYSTSHPRRATDPPPNLLTPLITNSWVFTYDIASGFHPITTFQLLRLHNSYVTKQCNTVEHHCVCLSSKLPTSGHSVSITKKNNWILLPVDIILFDLEIKLHVKIYFIYSVYSHFLPFNFDKEATGMSKIHEAWNDSRHLHPLKSITESKSQDDEHQSLGGFAIPERWSASAEVHFSLLDAGEDLLEESLVLRLLAVFRNHAQVRQSRGAGLPAAWAAAGRLDGFVAELVRHLLASLQQLIIFHLDNTHIS